MRVTVEPSRIVLARRMKCLSQTGLAKLMGVSLGAVSQWESGKRSPGDRVNDLSIILGEPVDFFFGLEVPLSEAKVVSFRKRHDASRQSRDFAAAAVDYASGVLTPAILSQFGRLPTIAVPNLKGMSPLSAADALRSEWGLSDAPLRNVVEQLEAKGVRVFWVNQASPSLSAFCKWVDGQPFVLLNSAKRDGCRSRFDACHELAHLVLHQDIDFDTADQKQLERDADAFASAFLLPRDTFLEDAPRAFHREYFLRLKSVWGVSVQAMVRRLHDLGVFSDWQYESAFRQMSKWGWRRQPEPHAGRLESSAIHWHLCDRLDVLDVAPKGFASSIPAAWERVSELMPLMQVRQSALMIPGPQRELEQFLDGSSELELPYDD